MVRHQAHRKAIAMKKYLIPIGTFFLGIALGSAVSSFIMKDDIRDTRDTLEYYESLNRLLIGKINEYEGLDDSDVIEENPELAQEDDGIFYVESLRELIEALGNDRTIYISKDINITDEISSIVPLDKLKFTYGDFNGTTYSVSSIYESDFYNIKYHINYNQPPPEDAILHTDSLCYSLTIKNTRNLRITGNYPPFTRVSIRNQESQVLGFKDNQNLRIENLGVYHDLSAEMDCSINAPVLSFYNDEDVIVMNCSLNGSGTIGSDASRANSLQTDGTIGIDASLVNSLQIDNTIIRNCSYAAITVSNIDYFSFNSGSIINNNVHYLIEQVNSNLNFNHTNISDNEGSYFLSGASSVHFSNCNITNNDLERGDDDLKINSSNNIDWNQFRENENTANSNEVQNNTEIDSPEMVKIKEVATSFHNWYINAENSNEGTTSMIIMEGENGKCRVDTSSYFKELRRIGTISEKFIAEEKLRFKDCIDFIENLDYSDYSTAEEYDFSEYCNFFYYMYWIQTQQRADGLRVESVKNENGKWYVTLNFYHEYEGEITYWAVYKPIVELERNNNSYMITKITWADK